MPQIAVKFWNVFGLEEGTDPEDINDATRDRIVVLYRILWRSHVVAPPSAMPRVVNGRNIFPDESGVDDGSKAIGGITSLMIWITGPWNKLLGTSD